jgi:ATP/maltotriose-dependent transcriptional regulator MalT
MANSIYQRAGGAAPMHALLALTAMAQEDPVAEKREVSLASADPPEYFLRFVLPTQAVRAAGRGQLRKARELLSQEEDLARQLGFSEPQAMAVCSTAWMGLLVGKKGGEKFDPARPLSISKGPDVAAVVALTLALSGNDSTALRMADELPRQRPQDTWFQALYVPAIRAQIEVNHGNGAKAIELLKAAQSYDKGQPGTLYLRGQAYLLNHQPEEAEKEFQAAIKLRLVEFIDPSAWLAQLYLARAYAMQGDTGKARTTYQDFLVLWKDADADIPLLTAAKSEYEKLQ